MSLSATSTEEELWVRCSCGVLFDRHNQWLLGLFKLFVSVCIWQPSGQHLVVLIEVLTEVNYGCGDGSARAQAAIAGLLLQLPTEGAPRPSHWSPEGGCAAYKPPSSSWEPPGSTKRKTRALAHKKGKA